MLASALRWLTGGLPRPALQPPFGDGNQFDPFAPFGGAGARRALRASKPARRAGAGLLAAGIGSRQFADAQRRPHRGRPRALAGAQQRLCQGGACARGRRRRWAPGIKPSALITSTGLRDTIQVAWAVWTDEADAEDVTDFYGLTRRVAREAFLAGECFVRFRPRFPQDGLSVPLQLQLMPSEQLPMYRLETVPDGQINAGGAIRMGIEFDRNLRDKRVAYWFFRSNPTDQTLSFTDALSQQSAGPRAGRRSDPRLRPGRGRSAARAHRLRRRHRQAVPARSLRRRGDRAAEAAGALRHLRRDVPGSGARCRRKATRWSRGPDDDPAVWGPGATVQLYPGEKVTFAQPAGVAGGYEPFQFRTLLQICAALGIPYAELSADLSKATYASIARRPAGLSRRGRSLPARRAGLSIPAQGVGALDGCRRSGRRHPRTHGIGLQRATGALSRHAGDHAAHARGSTR